MNRALFLVVTAALAAGCVAGAPPRVAGPAPVRVKAARFPGLTAAWAPGPNGAQGVQFAAKWLGDIGPFGDAMEPTFLLDDAEAALKATFGKVSRAATPEEAAAMKPDVVAIVDPYATFPRSVFGSASISETVTLITPDGAPLDELKIASEKKVTAETPFGMAFKRMKKTVQIAAADVREKLTQALSASPRLADAARGARRPAAEAAAPAVASSVVDRPAYARSEDDNAYAIVVGVEGYQSLPKADYAERDAAAVHEHLLALGYPERNVVYLNGPRAVKSALEKYVESWLPQRVGENSRVLFYFSGHGAPDVKTGSAYLMPWDGDAKFTAETAYPVKRLYEKLNALKARRVVVALDACFSGAGGRSVLPRGARPLLNKVETGDTGRLTVLAASAGDEISGADDAEGHGLFTYYLLDALQGRRGKATAGELYERLKPRVQDAARKENRDQTPQLIGPADAAL